MSANVNVFIKMKKNQCIPFSINGCDCSGDSPFSTSKKKKPNHLQDTCSFVTVNEGQKFPNGAFLLMS